MVLQIVVALISIVALMALHEFGHFIIAKKFGVFVEEFGIGYPPRMFGKKFGETFYSLNLLPFGAFVKIAGESEAAVGVPKERIFTEKTIGQRTWIILGGVFSFWIIAFLLLSVVYSMNEINIVSDNEPANNAQVIISNINSGSPAEQAGILAGDTIKGFLINGEEVLIDKTSEVQQIAEENKGKEIIMLVNQNEEVLEISLTPRVDPPAGEGAFGVGLVRIIEGRIPVWQASLRALESTAYLTVSVFTGWGSIISSLVSGNGLPSGVSFVGPIGIGSMMTQAIQIGLVFYLRFIAMISVYLAVFNILPIPALDGGKLMFLLIEKLKGSPVNQKLEQNITVGFFVFLLGVMAIVTVKDIINLF